MNATPKETTERAALNPTRYEFSYRNSFNDKYSADRDIDPDGEYIEYTPEVQEAIAAWNRRTAPSIPAQPGSGEAVAPEGWLIEWTDTHGARRKVSGHNAAGDYRAMGYENVTATELVRRTPASSDMGNPISATPAPADSARPTPWQDRMTAHYAKGSVQCHGSEHFMALELAEWREADSAAEIGSARYEYVRCLHPHEFASLWRENIAGVGKFDDLVDRDRAKRAAMQPKG